VTQIEIHVHVYIILYVDQICFARKQMILLVFFTVLDFCISVNHMYFSCDGSAYIRYIG